MTMQLRGACSIAEPDRRVIRRWQPHRPAPFSSWQGGSDAALELPHNPEPVNRLILSSSHSLSLFWRPGPFR
jgi:hypothetical protein